MANINGVDQETLNKINSQFTASSAVNNAKNLNDTTLNDLISYSKKSSSVVDQNTKNRMNAQFKMSSNTQNAINLTQNLLNQLTNYKGRYADQIDGLINQIANRDPFSYNADTDVLFQNALASAMRSGQTAMKDTMGQAAMLTGGYGSSYATRAGASAYNQFIDSAYDNLPQYYNMALNAYEAEGNRLNQNLAMYKDADADEYNKLANSYSANADNANTLYNREYQAWSDDVNNAYRYASQLMDEYSMGLQAKNAAYGAASQNYGTLYGQEYNAWNDMVKNAYSTASMQNNDYWSQAQLAENQRQFNASLAEQQRQFNASLAAKSSGGGSGLANGQGEPNSLTRKDVTAGMIAEAREQFTKGGDYLVNEYIDWMRYAGFNDDAINYVNNQLTSLRQKNTGYVSKNGNF